jgi:hypothetical protein
MTINSNIDGYYINRDFNVWKIYTKENITYMEHFASHARNTNEVFTIMNKTLKDGILTLILAGKPNADNPNPGTNLQCIIYKENDSVYLDEEKPTAREEINGYVVWKKELQRLKEFRKYDIDYHQDLFKKMQWLSLFYHGSSFYKDEIFIITPKYPIMEIVSINVNDDFIVQSVNIGEIEYENGMLYANIGNKKFSIEDDFIGKVRYIDLYYKSGKTRDIVYPTISDKLIKMKQEYYGINVKYFDFDVSNIIEKYKDSILVQFKKEKYILKNGIIIDVIPRSGETEIIEIIEQSNEKTVVEYFNTERHDYTKKVNLEIIFK